MPYCTLCQKEVNQLHYDIEQWILDTIRENHPHWVAEDGSCEPCVQYYGGLNGSKTGPPEN